MESHESIQNALRLYENIDALLAEGSFPGKFALAVNESRQFVQSLIANLKETTSGEPKQEAGQSEQVADPSGTQEPADVQPRNG